MKRFFAVISAAMLLCACSVAPSPRETTVTTVTGPADTAIPKQFFFAVDQNADEILISAAENFCRRVNSISDGAITLALLEARDPLEAFMAGSAGFLLLDGETAPALHPVFSEASERFRYGGYESFSMSCNSVQSLRLLSEACGANVFAAYYTGSNLFAGFAPADSILAFERGGTLAREVSALTIPGSGAADSLELVGVKTAEIPSAYTRFSMLSRTGSIVETTFSELVSQDFSSMQTAPDGSGIPVADGGEQDAHELSDNVSEYIVATRTFHSINPTWLILEPSAYESLSPQSRAAVSEAAACMSGDIDFAYLKQEQDVITTLEESGDVIFSDNSNNIRVRIQSRRKEPSADDTGVRTRFRELLDSFS